MRAWSSTVIKRGRGLSAERRSVVGLGLVGDQPRGDVQSAVVDHRLHWRTVGGQQ